MRVILKVTRKRLKKYLLKILGEIKLLDILGVDETSSRIDNVSI